jgi:hypothetical protein
MKEKILRDYLERKITVDILAADVKDSKKKTSYDVITVYIDNINEVGEFEITRSHLLKLLDDTIAERLTTTDLNTITFAIIGSDYFTWDEKDEVLGDTIHDLDNPDIGFQLTIENLERWKTYLKTGVYTFDKRELKRKVFKSTS